MRFENLYYGCTYCPNEIVIELIVKPLPAKSGNS